MKRYSTTAILISVLLVFSIFTLISISEVNAAEVISVNAKGYENTIIIEFENESTSKIKTIKVWPGGEVAFTSFKSEPGWGGGKYSDSKLLIFTATNTLNPGESVKFGLITDEKVNAINWKALDPNDNDIDKGKISIQVISETSSDILEEESKEVEQAKETGDELYGTKKFIPEQIRSGSDIRLVGSGFGSEKNLKLYLDSTILKSVNTDKQGNFLTTISIPDAYNVGTSEFIIKDEFENIQTTNINVKESKNRFLKTSNFEVNSIPAEIRYEETLTISGSAYPQSAIIIAFENNERVLEKTRVISANANGEWVFEETIERTDNLGEKFLIFKNKQDKTTKSLTVKSDYLIQISTSAVRYNAGEAVTITGTGEPNDDTTIWVKDQNKKIVHYDVFTSNADRSLNYEFATDDTFSSGTYTVIMKQEGGSDAALFGIGKYPTSVIVALMEKTNFDLNSKAIVSIVGPASSNLSITILDSNDNIKMTDSITSSSIGKNKYAIDLDGLDSGVYRVAVSSTNIQDSAKFSIGLESASGAISLVSTKSNYSPGESILIIGNTGNNARLMITLLDPSGNISATTETFSDSTGSFSTNDIGIPSDGILGDWKITAHNRLDSNSVEINVSIPTGKSLTLQIEGTQFATGDIIIIKGVGQSDSNRLEIKITNESDEVVESLHTPITSSGAFNLPWTIPDGFDTGIYTITVSDDDNSSSFEIFIQ
uniref:Uncharacterized protein n=1 Tax=uncultured marine thaumarchaeote SAT1000_41_C02 TaxID=1456409 RepID=A0A075IDC7_9ARCH|nr:hypothetical protein [uncultured marine thaumarchaeote SAT1000_41_C02]